VRALFAAVLVVAVVGAAAAHADPAGPDVVDVPGDPVEDVLGLLFPTSTSTSTTSSTSSSTTTSSTTTTTTPAPECSPDRRRGATDVGVTEQRVMVGAVTVETGPAAAFLRDQTLALQAVVARANAAGGVCGRTVELDLRDGGWGSAAGSDALRDLETSSLLLAVNPDSQALHQASADGFLTAEAFPVVGTDGLLANQFADPYIWPVGPSMRSFGGVAAGAQYDAGLRHPSVVFETSFGIGRPAAEGYDAEWVRRAGSGVPGASAGDGCNERYCGVRAFQASYASDINRLSTACASQPACDAGLLTLDPQTAQSWFHSGGGAGGAAEPDGGAGAAPPLLFSQEFAASCGSACDGVRLWTAFRPPVSPFDSEPAVAQYVADLRAVSTTVDVVDQNVQAAYVGATLAIRALTQASSMPGGLTRANVATALDSTSGWNSGLTAAPLSWSPGDHDAADTLHAFDIVAGSGFRFVPDSTRPAP
ncbi:MAG TPA: ABC transporter substrate-binding protein, partial [Acidimicrobiia bacterium]|nr:ABC transporter substrate-binding protein [Acidimicrobiia bacterium]